MFHQDCALQQLLKWCIHKGHRSIKQAVQSISHCLAQLLCNEPPWTFMNSVPEHNLMASCAAWPQTISVIICRALSASLDGGCTCKGWGHISSAGAAQRQLWPKAQGRDRISKPLSTISAGFERGNLQALTAVLVFHPLLQLSVQTAAPVTSHIPWPPSGASTEKGCKGEERLFWVLNSAKEENCPVGQKREEGRGVI